MEEANDDDSDDWEDCADIATATKASPPIRLPTESSPSLRALAPGLQAIPAMALPPQAVAEASPSLAAAPLDASPPALGGPSAPTGMRLVRIKERVIPFKRAPCKRPSRAARPSEPSSQARDICRQLVQTREGELKGAGRTRLPADDSVRYRSGGASGGKGPAIRAQVGQEQAKMNHIAQLKARNIETYNAEASFLLWGNTAEQCYDRLAESALRANAGNSCVTKRQPTQGAGYQSECHCALPKSLPASDVCPCFAATRINCKTVGQAAAAQCVNVAITMAIAEAELRGTHGVPVRCPAAGNAVDPCVFASTGWLADDDDPDDLVGVVSTGQLVYNARPTKLGIESIRSAAKKLAKLECAAIARTRTQTTTQGSSTSN